MLEHSNYTAVMNGDEQVVTDCIIDATADLVWRYCVVQHVHWAYLSLPGTLMITSFQ